MEVASSSLSMNIVNIDDDNEENDDISVIYTTPNTSKGKQKKSISVENYFYSKPSCSGTKKVLIDLSEDDEIMFLGTHFVKKSNGVANINSIVIEDDKEGNFTCIRVDEKSGSEIFKIMGTQFEKKSNGVSNIKSIVIVDDDDDKEDNFTCDICVDVKCVSKIFKIMGCDHCYCNECMSKYVGMKIQENVCRICCPVSGCNGILEPYNCRSILPKQVFDRWGDVLCEAMILGSEKFYCPFKDCSALLIDENGSGGDGGGVIQSECPECRRLFCVKCKVGWHSEMLCEDFQKLNKDEREKEDLQLMQLAKGQEWKRCPRCRMYVERTDGCAQMRCRCGCYFCYKCGAVSSTDHYCKSCGT